MPAMILPTLLLMSTLASGEPPTYYERSGTLETPRLAETMADCRALAKASPWIRVTHFGRSPQGRELPLVIVDKDRAFDPKQARAAGKAVIMIQACIHAGEPEGKDAGLLFIRDLCVTKTEASLLDHVVLVFLPIFNVDGHERFSDTNRINQNGPKEAGWRANATNLNLNRDYLKADAPEMRAWLKLYQTWLPDFFIDCHTTDGADYPYVLTYGEEVGKDSTWYLEPHVGNWLRNRFLNTFRNRMEHQGLPVTHYLTFRSWHDPRSGLVNAPSRPMYSHGYQSAQNRASLLLETHMLKPYAVRVEATRAALRHATTIVAEDRKTLLELNRNADRFTASPAFRKEPMALTFQEDGTTETVAFKGYAYTKQTSDLTGGDWFTYDPTHPVTFQIPYANRMMITQRAHVPEAYIVPEAWAEVIARIQAHGIQCHRLTQPTALQVTTTRFANIVWGTGPSEGRLRIASITQEARNEYVKFNTGTWIIPTNQRTARIIVHLLEPDSEDSLLRWGFFNSIFEQKEYGESYVLEVLAREMLAKDPKLAKSFEDKKIQDPEFAKQPEAILNWFFLNSPFADPYMNLYPVAKLFDASQLTKALNQIPNKNTLR